MGGTLLCLDFGNTSEIIKALPQDLFAELTLATQARRVSTHASGSSSVAQICQQIIQYLQCNSAAVNSVELCERFQAAGIEIAPRDLEKVINAISFVFRTAAKNKLSSEEFSTRLGSAVGILPKQAQQVIQHIWNEQGRSIMALEEAQSLAAVGQLIDFQWKLGMAVSSDSCKSLKSPYVTMALKVTDASGCITSKTFEMTIPQFQNFYSQFKDMAAVLETV